LSLTTDPKPYNNISVSVDCYERPNNEHSTKHQDFSQPTKDNVTVPKECVAIRFWVTGGGSNGAPLGELAELPPVKNIDVFYNSKKVYTSKNFKRATIPIYYLKQL